MDARRQHDNSSNESLIDPLIEQMQAVLRLGNRSAAAEAEAHRRRRSSDADISSPSRLPTHPLVVRSKDGTRWLPAPAEQAHRYDHGGSINRSPDPVSIGRVPAHNCTTAECAVAKLFATTELLELILNHLSTIDVLRLRLVSSKWNNLIHTSPNLRLHLYIHPIFSLPGSSFRLLSLINVPGLEIKLGDPLHLGQWIQIHMTPGAAFRISPHTANGPRRTRSRSIYEGLRGGLGSQSSSSSQSSWPLPEPSPTSAAIAEGIIRYKDLLIAQPPPVNAQASILNTEMTHFYSSKGIEHAVNIDGSYGAVAKLHCDAGITLGFLAETAQKLTGGNETLRAKMSKGEVKVVFRTIVSFCDGTDAAPRKRNATGGMTIIG